MKLFTKEEYAGLLPQLLSADSLARSTGWAIALTLIKEKELHHREEEGVVNTPWIWRKMMTLSRRVLLRAFTEDVEVLEGDVTADLKCRYYPFCYDGYYIDFSLDINTGEIISFLKNQQDDDTLPFTCGAWRTDLKESEFSYNYICLMIDKHLIKWWWKVKEAIDRDRRERALIEAIFLLNTDSNGSWPVVEPFMSRREWIGIAIEEMWSHRRNEISSNLVRDYFFHLEGYDFYLETISNPLRYSFRYEKDDDWGFLADAIHPKVVMSSDYRTMKEMVKDFLS